MKADTRTWLHNLERAFEVLRGEGLASLWFKALSRTIYRRVILFERSLAEAPGAPTGSLPVTIDLLQEHEINEYLSLRPAADSHEIRRRLQAGEWCFVARCEGQLVHACWAAAGRAWIEYLAREIQLAPDQVYSFESLTAPGWRGQNIAGARSAYMARFLLAAGYRRMIAVVVPENKPALRAVEKVGYRPFGVMGYIKLGKWRHDFCWLNREHQSRSLSRESRVGDR